jgi:hypothetical protein
VKNYSIIIIFILKIISAGTSYSQESGDSIYGLNSILYNGKLYSFNLSDKTKGHPYLYSADYEKGSIIIKEIKFDNVLLNYDIYNQELLLKYKDIYGSYRILMVSKAWLNGFDMHNSKFELINCSDGQKRFFQVIGCDSISVLFYWEKKLSLSDQIGNKDLYYSDPGRSMYLYKKGQFFRFRSNKNFINYFNSDVKNEIKYFINGDKINVKKASDEKILRLITYCNEVMN